MRPLYDLTRKPKRKDLAAIQAILGAGPWVWELDQRAAWEGVHGRAAPQSVPVGAALALAFEGQDQGSVWALGGAGEAAALGRAAHEALGLAEAALPRALPLLWRSLAGLRRPRALLLGALTEGGYPPQHLEGDSLGLAAALAMASEVLAVPLPQDVVAAATLSALGQTGPVSGLAPKLEALRQCARGVFCGPGQRARLLVHPDNRGEVEAADIDAVAVRSLSEAIALVWGEGLEERLLARIQPDDRAAWAEGLFALALGDRSAAREWTPVARAATAALGRWDELGEDHRFLLETARMIALRHQGQDQALPLPTAAQLGRLPQPLRLTLVAHRVQQALVSLEPSPEEVERFARPHLVEGDDAFEAHLKLQGALARLWASTGRPAEALAAQRALAAQWERRWMYQEISYPLSEVYRLASALPLLGLLPWRAASAALSEAEAWARRAQWADPMTLTSYLRLWRAVASALMGDHWPGGGRFGEALEELRALCEDPREQLHLRLSARRHLIRILRLTRQPVEAHVQALRELSLRLEGDRHNLIMQQNLVALDEALDGSGDEGVCQAHLSALIVTRSALMTHLMAAARRRRVSLLAQARYVSVLFPY